MSYSLEYRERDGYILLRMMGDLNADVARPAIKAWLAMAAEYDCRRMLVDYTDCRVVESTLGMFDLAAKLGDVGVPRTVSIASVVHSDLKDHLFVETVAQNRGWIYRVFSDFEEAERWLKSS
jgi:hypothetical protein